MANVSEAYGTIYARADKKETLEAIGLLLDVHQGLWYPTEADYDESVILEEDGSFLFNISFTGAGRWCYESNVQHFFDSAWGEIDEADPKLSAELKAAFELLDKEAFELSFDFHDCERGLNHLCIQVMRIIVDKDQKVSGGNTQDLWSNEYLEYIDPSPRNLYEYDFIEDYYNFNDLDDIERFFLDNKDEILYMNRQEEGFIFSEEGISELLNEPRKLEKFQKEILDLIPERSAFIDVYEFVDYLDSAEVKKSA